VKAGDSVYARVSASGTQQLGALRNDADGTAQVDTLTPTAVNSTEYFVNVNGRLYSYVSDSTATAAEIVTGFKTAMTNDPDVTATGTSTLILTAKVAGAAFTTGADPNMSIAHTTANAAKAALLSRAKFLDACSSNGLSRVQLELV
jgi:hypothetical protein